MIAIGVFDDGAVHITLPEGTTDKEALKILLEKAEQEDPSMMITFLTIPNANTVNKPNPGELFD